jgi:phosphoglycolate phosphatase-like HAD superfamily hydrolase
VRKKLILFDIDGTLITTGGVAVRLMISCVTRVLGHPVQWNIKDFVGNTDRNILATIFRINGSSEALLEDFIDEALHFYLEELPQVLNKDGIITVLPGVKQLLETLEKDDSFALGLLTGNIRDGAQLKLSAAALDHYFPIGAYGSDALKRNDLPPFAIQRAEKYYHHIFEKKDIWIIGDSVYDIHCAHAHHLNCLAVASGRITKNDLRNNHPKALVSNLKDEKSVIAILMD